MSEQRTIVVKGSPEVEEAVVITAGFLPGTLLVRTVPAGVVSFAPSTLDGALAAPLVAMERSELGTGVDDSQQSQGTPTAAYVVGDVVKVGYMQPGVEYMAMLEDEQNITAGDNLAANVANGTLRAAAAGENIVAQAMEDLDLTGAPADALIHVRATHGYLDV